MRLGVIKKILKEDLGAGGQQLPPWLDPFMGALNTFIDQVVSALQGRLTFADNFSSKSMTQEMTHGVALAVNPQVSTQQTLRPLGLLCLGASEGYLIDSFGYTRNQNGSFGITVRFLNSDGTAVSAGTTAKVDLVILLG
jgi:hypothetical protein